MWTLWTLIGFIQIHWDQKRWPALITLHYCSCIEKTLVEVCQSNQRCFLEMPHRMIGRKQQLVFCQKEQWENNNAQWPTCGWVYIVVIARQMTDVCITYMFHSYLHVCICYFVFLLHAQIRAFFLLQTFPAFSPRKNIKHSSISTERSQLVLGVEKSNLKALL